MLYALDPAKISGVNFEWNAFERPYVKKEVQEQPVVGGFSVRVKFQTSRCCCA